LLHIFEPDPARDKHQMRHSLALAGFDEVPAAGLLAEGWRLKIAGHVVRTNAHIVAMRETGKHLRTS
jgi:hypothetical protein